MLDHVHGDAGRVENDEVPVAPGFIADRHLDRHPQRLQPPVFGVRVVHVDGDSQALSVAQRALKRRRLGLLLRGQETQLAAAQLQQNEPVAVEQHPALKQAHVEIPARLQVLGDHTGPEFHRVAPLA